MARANPQHLEDVAKLNGSDQQGLRAMLAQLEATQAHIKELLMQRGEVATPVSAERVRDSSQRPSTPRRSFDALMTKLPSDPTATFDLPKELLPSPPATDNQPEDKSKADVEHDTVIAASASPTVEVKPEAQDDDLEIE